MIKILKSYLSHFVPRYIQCYIKIMFIRRGRHTFIRAPFRIDQPRNISLGNDCYVGDRSTISCYGGKLIIGNRFYVTQSLNLYCGEKISIGSDVLIGSYVLITDFSHGIDPTSELNYQKQSIVTRCVSIGNGCWIGDKVSILPGSHIGEKCVVGCNSVVNGDFPSYSMIAGNPAKIVKRWSFSQNSWLSLSEV